MRTWIEDLEAVGELIRLDKPVDPLTQMGSLLYQCREKAVFFENLPHGWRSPGQAPANIRHAAIEFIGSPTDRPGIRFGLQPSASRKGQPPEHL
jgi:hypothetical protein